MKHVIKRAIGPAAVTGLLAPAILGAPELIVFVILAVLGFVSAVAGILVFWRVADVGGWSPGNQRAAIWLAASVAAPAECLVLLAPGIFR